MSAKIIDELMPETVIIKEFGICLMTWWRWSQDPELQALGFPKQQFKIRSEKFRSRTELEMFKYNLMRRGIAPVRFTEAIKHIVAKNEKLKRRTAEELRAKDNDNSPKLEPGS